MTLGIMFLDMFKIRRVPEGRIFPIQMSEPTVKRWVSTSNVPNVAFEVLYIDRVEPDDGRVHSDVSFRKSGAE